MFGRKLFRIAVLMPLAPKLGTRDHEVLGHVSMVGGSFV
jgi:hypothetical protein